jgi:uncharacterized membrane protein (DUF4010 family)
MVVMIASISFSGYFAIRAAGPDKGIALTSLFAGLASSTALTLHFARLSRRPGLDVNLLASGILLATATLFPRILAITVVLHKELALALLPPMSMMALVVLLPGLLSWARRSTATKGKKALRLENPLELGAALRFGALLAAVMLLTRLLSDVFGAAGVLVLGIVSGLADLNAITLSVIRISQESLDLSLAAWAVTLASVSNGIFKSAVAWIVGGSALGLRVALPVLLAGIAGPLILLITDKWPL